MWEAFHGAVLLHLTGSASNVAACLCLLVAAIEQRNALRCTSAALMHVLETPRYRALLISMCTFGPSASMPDSGEFKLVHRPACKQRVEQGQTLVPGIEACSRETCFCPA